MVAGIFLANATLRNSLPQELNLKLLVVLSWFSLLGKIIVFVIVFIIVFEHGSVAIFDYRRWWIIICAHFAHLAMLLASLMLIYVFLGNFYVSNRRLSFLLSFSFYSINVTEDSTSAINRSRVV